jgi:succinoglycan biosynthesis transport protein ExoP
LNQYYKIDSRHSSRPPVLAGAEQASSPGAREEIIFDLSYIVTFLRRQWAVIALFSLAGLILAMAYLFVTPARYTATSVLMLDTRRLQVFQPPSVVSEMSFDAPAVDSQLEILKSDAIAMSVIRALDLVNDPEFSEGATSFIGSIVSTITALLHRPQDDPVVPPSKQELTQRAVKSFKSNLSVQRIGRSYVIEISFHSLDKVKAPRIANAIGEAYILDQVQARYTATNRVTDWLKERINKLRQEAEGAELSAIEFRRKNGLTDADGKLLSEQQLSQVNTQLIVAKAQTSEAKARLDRILEISKRGIDDAVVVDSLQNGVLNQLQQQYIDTAKREADFSFRYGRDHVAAVNLRKEMQQIQEVSKTEMNRIAESYKSEFAIARSREQSLQASLDDLTLTSAGAREAQIRLRMLESSANAYRTLHDNFVQRLVETIQQQSSPNTEARLITEAASAQQTHPRTQVALAVAVLFGACLGSAVCFAREVLDRVFRTTRQVEQALGVECMGVIPYVASPKTQAPIQYENQPHVGARSITGDLGIARQVVLAPFSRFSETIRAIKVAADTSTGSRGMKVIALVSALPGEGKSVVACNLAQFIAHSGRDALLIDADLRNPSLSRRIAPQASRGTLEVIDGTAQLSDTIWRDPITGLDFLPTVLQRPIAHTSEVLASDQTANLLALARDQYEYVVIDLPPLAPVVDAKAVARHVDAFVLVIEWGQTSPEAIFEALGSAEVVHSKLLGAVLNKADAAKLKKLEAYKGGSYHKYYDS